MKYFNFKKINLITLLILSFMILNCQKKKVQQNLEFLGDSKSNTYNFTPIKSYKDFELIRQNPTGSFILTSDIVFPKDHEFEPIPIFSGILDGGVHLEGEEEFVIYNLNINLPNQDNIGLFGQLQNAEIRNLNIGYAKVTGGNMVGVIAGQIQTSKIINSMVYESKIYGKNNVGGMVGLDDNSLFKNITWGGNQIHGDTYIGGLIGSAMKSTIFEGNTENTDHVFGLNYVGGIVGFSKGIMIDKVSQYIGEIHGNKYVGGLIGRAENSEITNSNLYVEEIYGTEKIGGFFGSLDNSRVIRLKNYNISENITATIELGGIVGEVTNSYLSNITIDIPDLEAQHYVGGVAGYAQNTEFVKIKVNSGTLKGQVNVGGLIGLMIDGTMHLSSANVQVKAKTPQSRNIGGLIGNLTGNNAIIEDSYATGSVTGTNYTGGLIGHQVMGKVNKTYSTGIVTGTQNTTAALIGYRDNGSLINSYSAVGSYTLLENRSSSAPLTNHVKFLTEAEAKQQSSFNTWNFFSHWYFKGNEAWPKLY